MNANSPFPGQSGGSHARLRTLQRGVGISISVLGCCRLTELLIGMAASWFR